MNRLISHQPPIKPKTHFFSSFDNFIGQMKEIEALDMEQNPRQKRQEILHAVGDAYQQIYTACNQLNPALSVNVGIAGRGETESVLEQLLVKAKAGADQIENLKAQKAYPSKQAKAASLLRHGISQKKQEHTKTVPFFG